MNTHRTPEIKVPLGRKIHEIASEFAAEQATPRKGKKVYLNTLAVYAVHSYLKWLQFETDLSQGDSWQPDLRCLFDVADLVIPGVGKLECRPLLPGETTLALPPETVQDRFGCVVIQFDENLNEVELLGFVSAKDFASNSLFSIADLQSLETLLKYIPTDSKSALDNKVSVFTNSKKLTNIRLWGERIFSAGWQSVDALFSKENNPAWSVRSAEQGLKPELRRCDCDRAEVISGGKLINLGVQVVDRTIALTIKAEAVTDTEVEICLRVYPTSGQTYLPSGLQLILLDEVGVVGAPVVARKADNCLQMQFNAEIEELFGVQIELGGFSMKEYFIFS